MRPNTVSAAAHPRNAPRWSRHTSPAGLSRSGGGRVAATLRPQSPADVPARGERDRRGQQQPEGRERDHQRPPVAAAERAGLLSPADRGEPDRPGAGDLEPGPVDGAQHVADAAERERDAEDPHRDAGGAAGGGGQLAGHRRDADPDQSHRGHRGAGQQRALHGLPVDARSPPRSRGRARCSPRWPRRWPRPGRRTADDGGGEHLGAAELLVLAGVPDHREGAHQCRRARPA